MVNLGLNLSSLLGIILAVAGAGLYFLRSWRPKLARDHDIFFAAVGLLCGGILLFQGWRLDPILAFGQFLLAGSAIFFAAESIKLRGATTAQAKSRSQYVDEERPVSNAYAYDGYDSDLDQIEAEEDYPQRPRIRGSQDNRSSRESYDDEPRRRPSSNRNGSANTSRESIDRSSSRKRPSRPEAPPAQGSDNWDVSDNPEERPTRSRSNRPPASENRSSDAPPRTKKTRPAEGSRSRPSNRDVEAPPSDYVEYRPVEYPEDQPDNSPSFDK
ncbi:MULTISPECIES: Ycf66 family protein [unclassified Microcoleus]|uniref:Ycf66 family protein n=1 Tax=unclassified Microcoleus TaxID=2642155 RepID=UPI002FCF6513